MFKIVKNVQKKEIESLDTIIRRVDKKLTILIITGSIHFFFTFVCMIGLTVALGSMQQLYRSYLNIEKLGNQRNETVEKVYSMLDEQRNESLIKNSVQKSKSTK